jgi:hypothetical protein
MTKIGGSGSASGSGSISQRHGSADPDPNPHQNVMDPQHWFVRVKFSFGSGSFLIKNLLQGSKRRVKERLRPYVKDAWACDLIDKLLSLDPAKRYLYPVDPSCSTVTAISVAELELIFPDPISTIHFLPGPFPDPTLKLATCKWVN